MFQTCALHSHILSKGPQAGQQPHVAMLQLDTCLDLEQSPVCSLGRGHTQGDSSNPNRDLSGKAGRAEAGESRDWRLLKAPSELVFHSWQNSPSNSRGNLKS